MRRSLKKTLIKLLVMSLIYVPFQSLLATTKINLSEDSTSSINKPIKTTLISIKINELPSCEHCKQHNCHEKHQCNNGQCSSTAAIILHKFKSKNIVMAKNKPNINKEGLVISPLSSLYRPPKQ